ncbi:MAG: hypothetical protein PHE25_05645, partial [Candidatus Gracilibacteria bacterium]|nr:hypothetical protein [Candidatus Gracilibacteria bacterium]
MNIQKIFFTFLIIAFLLFFIFNSTYFYTKNKLIADKNLFDVDVGFQEIVNSGSKIELKNMDKITKDGIYVDNVNLIDKVYFSSKNYSKKINNNNIVFQIGSGGIFIFDLYDLTNNFNINGDTFYIKPKSPGKIFIDNRNNEDIKIFSFDSIFDLSLKNNGQEMTKLAIYPKIFFGFSSSRNKFLKNADLLRIDTLSNIFYFNQNFLTKENKINFLFFKKIYSKNDGITFDFLNVFLSLVYSSDKTNKYNPDNINSNLFLGGQIDGYDYINRYFLIFLNDEKKIIYYEKNIINNLNKLFKNKERIDKDETIDSLNGLKELNKVEYDKFIKIIYYYYDNLLKINSLDYIDNTFLLSEIILNHKSGTNLSFLKSSFFLNKVYFLINNKTYELDYLQTSLLEFLSYYLKENHINIENDYSIKVENKNIIKTMEYLSFFIKNILLYNVKFSDVNNIKNILGIYNIYINFKININNFSNFQKSGTIIIENSFIIDKILYEIRNNFFKNDLNKDGLLELSDKNTLDSDKLDLLNNVVNSFFNFYKLRKGGLEKKDQIYNDIYAKNRLTYTQYYDALKNYSEYRINYNKKSITLLETQTLLEQKNQIILSKQNLIDYLSYFEGLDMSKLDFEIIKNQHYEIRDLYINGEKFSFDLYPLESNGMKNIFRNGEKLTSTYDLDNVKYTWDKAYQDANDDEKEEYSFK